MGHVGLVDVVGPDYIEVSDDGSGDTTRRMRISRGSPYWPSSFIHIWDRTAVPELAARAFAVGAAPFGPGGPGAEVAGWWTTNRSVARQPWSWLPSVRGTTPRDLTARRGLPSPVLGEPSQTCPHGQAPATRARWGSLDVLRGIALWMMLVHHLVDWFGGAARERLPGFEGFAYTDLAAPMFAVGVGRGRAAGRHT